MVIIQNDVGNRHSPIVIVAAISSQISNRPTLPTHYHLGAKNGLLSPSVILLEQLRTIDKQRLEEYIGHLSDAHIWGLNHALSISTGLVIIIVIMLVALIVGSCFGIFFSSEDTGSPMTMKSVVQEINMDYQSSLDTIRNMTVHDKMETSGSRAVWPEVLAVYSVKVNTDPNNPQDVASMDNAKKATLEEIFWAMNQINSHVETTEETVLIEEADEDGNIIVTETTETVTTLYITVTHKTATTMAYEYGFTEEQKQMLNELLQDENASMWAAVLYGIHSADEQIVAVAESQIGNVGGQPYWSWYGFNSRVAWCACFVSWCANECGYIDAGVIPKFAGCVWGVEWFQDRGQWADGTATPVPGMIIFFDWDSPDGESGPQDGLSDHVGIVQKVEDGYVYTIEGNTSDSCAQRRYRIGYYEILGYGIPAY